MNLIYSDLVIILLFSLTRSIHSVVDIRDFTKTFEIPEKTLTQTQITRIDCSSTDNTCKCNVAKTDPLGAPFDVWKSGGSFYYVFFVGVNNGKPLSYVSVPSYRLTIECQNAAGTESDFADLEVDVKPNAIPVITNPSYPHDVIKLSSMSSQWPPGSGIYTVTGTDADNDVLSCSMTSSPAVNYFKIVSSGTTDCVIQTTVDLRAVTEANVKLTVSMSDGRSTVNNFDIDVITDLNTRPDIINLPSIITVPENAAGDTVITQLFIQDPDPYVPQMIPTCTVVPNSEQFKFKFDSANRIKLATSINGVGPLDYETTTQYEITCVVNDGFLESQNEVLTLKISNVNEPPVFDEIAYYCDLDESSAGGSSCALNAVITDPEGDVIISVGFLNGNNSNRFRYDKSTSSITFNVDYDVDQNAMPEVVVLQLEARDKYGASKTAPVYIKVHDVNDNTCDFGPKSTNTFHADQGTSLGSMGNIMATDADRTSPNNHVTYEVIQALPADSTNYIAAFSDGSLSYIGLIPEQNHGKSYSLVVRCKDGGSPQRTAVGTVVLTYQTTTSSSTTSTTTTTTTTTPPPPTTQPPNNIFDHPAFVAVFSLLMAILGLALLSALYFLLRYCGVCGNREAAPEEASGQLLRDNFCCPKKKKVEPVEDYFTYEVRTNNDYRDSYWKKGDNYETGHGYNPLGETYSKPLEGFQHLALPPPPHRGADF
ncbi:protocadherin Fat 3 [Biomphalaria pfeifferi]|uniref:Protocadherin Fat 3 n=1 Tax=Biomphalaria pfeifferi TaxID=112525 RepID=A0AAD8FID9_BIOPF|nr:protocadherin Fat 3 [Biomphalaria pfeifferi]